MSPRPLWPCVSWMTTCARSLRRARVALILLMALTSPFESAARDLIAASSNNFPPINQLDEQGNLDGFAHDLTQAVARELGITIRHLHSPFYKDALRWLETGEADFIHDTAYSPERAKLFDYSEPIIKMDEVTFVLRDEQAITGLQSLNDKLVACVEGHITHQYIAQYTQIECHLVQTPIEGVFAMLQGHADAFIYPRDIIWALALRANVADKIKTVGTPLRTLSWSMIVQRGNTQTLTLLNEGLSKVKSSGEYDRIYAKWFGGETHTSTSPHVFFDIALVVLTLILLALIWRLRKKDAALRRSFDTILKSERELKLNEGRFQAVVHSALDGIVTIDAQGIIESINPAIEAMFNYQPEELIGRSINVLMTDADAAFHAQYISAYLQTGKARIIGQGSRHLLGQRKDGSIFPMEIGVNEFMVEDRHMFAGIIRNITERVNHEQELRDSETRAAQAEQRLIHALDSISDGFVIYDAEDRLFMCNDKFRQMWSGMSDLLVPGTTFEEMAWALAERKLVDIPEDGIDDWVGERILAHRRGHGSFSVRLKDGTWILHHDRRMRDGGYVGVRTNVTDLKLREEALIEEKQRLADAQRIASLGNWEVNLMSGEVTWSDEMYTMFARPQGSTPLNLEEFLSLIHEDDREKVKQAYQMALNDEAPYRTTYRILTENGPPLVVESEGRVERNEDGAPLRMIGINHDITELKQQQAEIEHSHKLLSLISTMQSEFIMETDPHDLFQTMLETILELTGSTYAITGEVMENPDHSHSYSLSHCARAASTPYVGLEESGGEHALPQLSSLFDIAIAEGQPHIVNAPLTLPQESEDLSFENFLVIPMFSGGKAVGVLGLANRADGYGMDVARYLEPLTATCGNILEAYRHGLLRAQAEQAMIESEQRYRGLVERSPDPIIVHRNLIILYVNEAATQLFGYDDPMDLVGRGWLEFVPEEFHEQSRERARTVTGTDLKLPLVHLPVIRRDGSVIDTEAQVSGIVYNGEPALESVVHDISERIKAQRALKESEERYRLLIDKAPDAIIVHSNGEIVFANQAALDLFLAERAEQLVGRDMLDLVHPDSQDSVSERIISSIEGDPLEGLFEDRMLKLDGSIMECEVTATHILFNGQPARQTMMRDVTQRKLMDAQMVQTAKLATLGEMAAGMAHELSQPLNIIRFAAEGAMLKISKGQADKGYQEKQFDTIQTQAVRMAEIMDNVRIFSRSDSGKVELFDPNHSLQSVATMVRNPYKAEGIKLSLRGTGLGLLVSGRQIQLEQVVLNLVKNAHDAIVEYRKAHPDGPEGRIEISCIHNEVDDQVVIAISDTGGGIPEDELERIFDPFYTTKDVGAGTGLGLSVSFGIIANMGGVLSAANTKKGARFCITLPVSGQADSEPPPVPQPKTELPSAPAADIQSCHILVVDDEVEATQAMAQFLEDEGYRVTTAHNGEEGLEAFANAPADLVITDLRMPT